MHTRGAPQTPAGRDWVDGRMEGWTEPKEEGWLPAAAVGGQATGSPVGVPVPVVVTQEVVLPHHLVSGDC